ncbi:MAG: zinc ABC transporter substrate-binding protein [Bacteriovorax sp.]|nr:zinc ABC transporter substrate-binding protein [Bacteriovorax sp.]
MKIKIVLSILFLVFSRTSFAKNTMYCSHPEICKMLDQIIKENSSDKNLAGLSTESLISVTGDPHEYEPSVNEIKKLMNAPILITGPNELNPWIKKINFQRRKIASLKTASLLFDQQDYLSYAGASGEALSHFWLYPKVYCSLKNKLIVELKNLGINNIKNQACIYKKVEDDLRLVLAGIKKPIILTHDALLPLLLNLSPDQTLSIVAIKGSGHHEETSPISIKKMYNALSAPQVIWIQETGINIPQNIINKIRPNDQVIKIDTANSVDQGLFSIIVELTKKLASISEKKL